MEKDQNEGLDRREFIKSAGAGLAGLALILNQQSMVQAGETESTVRAGEIVQRVMRPQPRYVIPLNHRWLFSEKNIQGASDEDFDDSRFSRVTIPHTNQMLPWHGFDDKDYQFISIYRRHFKLPQEFRGRRIFVDFGGVMTAATVTLNGQRLGEYRGGYTPFSFELTPNIRWNADNVLAVEVDSTERADIPPFGGEIDYLTFGGIYRDVALRVVGGTFIENVFAKPKNVLGNERSVDVRCFLNKDVAVKGPLKLTVELRDGERVMSTQNRDLPAAAGLQFDLTLSNVGAVDLWDLNNPKLYSVRTCLYAGAECIDEYNTRIGFREARFTPAGFILNGKHVKLRGLNRHQTFPYVGQAMPARVQRRDAWILKKELKCNIVRTSHYPQSPHFLDACDELGLLVFEEIPGWQHIGDQGWKDLSVLYVETMIRRDWNHPSIILWGARVNESKDDHDFYTRTNALAHSLDDSRQTGGVRYRYESERLEDVFTMNDFGFPLRPPNHPLYLNTEFIGHTYPTKRNDNVERVMEHTVRHARVHNQLGSDDKYAGGLGWCAFGYNTHSNFCSGDRICYHGVSDIFRIPKAAAGFYKSQCDPGEEIVLEPAFDWARGDRNSQFDVAMVCSNCEQIKFYIADRLVAEAEPDRKNFENLPHPPFIADLGKGIGSGKWGDLRIEGYKGGRKVVTKTLSGSGADRMFHVEPDDKELIGDGIDATRVVLRVTDEYGSPRSFATGAITLSIQGPGQIVRENPMSLAGGVGAVWIKTREGAGTIRLDATHPALGTKTVEIRVQQQPVEEVVI